MPDRLGLVLVVPPPPVVRFVAPFRRAIEPLVRAPDNVQSAPVSRISVVNDPVLERERAHARPFARVRGEVGASSAGCRARPVGCWARGNLGHRLFAYMIVFDAFALLLRREGDIEIKVEI